MHAEERSSAAIRLEIEEVDAEDESHSDFSDRSMSGETDSEPSKRHPSEIHHECLRLLRARTDIEMDDEPGRNRSLKRAAGRQSSGAPVPELACFPVFLLAIFLTQFLHDRAGVRRRKRRSCQSVPYLSMLEPATPHDFPLLLSPLSALPERTAAVDYSESQVPNRALQRMGLSVCEPYFKSCLRCTPSRLPWSMQCLRRWSSGKTKGLRSMIWRGRSCDTEADDGLVSHLSARFAAPRAR